MLVIEGLEEFVRSELTEKEPDVGSEPVLEIQSEERQEDDNDVVELGIDEGEDEVGFDRDDLASMIDEALRGAMPYALGRLED